MAKGAIATENFEEVEVASQEALWSWLEANHGQTDSVWLVTWKKSAGARYVSTSQVLDALVAYGWIDGIRRKLDDSRTRQLVSPRKEQRWAQSYKDRVARLQASGRMMPPGQAAIARAKAAGLWDADAAIDALTIPQDLRLALAQDQTAHTYFDAAAPSYKRNVLRWIARAKRDETRAKRVAATVAASARRQRLPQM